MFLEAIVLHDQGVQELTCQDGVHCRACQLSIARRQVDVRPTGHCPDASQGGGTGVAQDERAPPELALQEAVWQALHACLSRQSDPETMPKAAGGLPGSCRSTCQACRLQAMGRKYEALHVAVGTSDEAPNVDLPETNKVWEISELQRRLAEVWCITRHGLHILRLTSSFGSAGKTVNERHWLCPSALLGILHVQVTSVPQPTITMTAGQPALSVSPPA